MLLFTSFPRATEFWWRSILKKIKTNVDNDDALENGKVDAKEIETLPIHL